jgi:hypothetical protein
MMALAPNWDFTSVVTKLLTVFCAWTYHTFTFLNCKTVLEKDAFCDIIVTVSSPYLRATQTTQREFNARGRTFLAMARANKKLILPGLQCKQAI